MPDNTTVDERTSFSALTESVSALVEAQRAAEEGLSGIVVCGLEAHGSVLQTALGLLRSGTPVYIPVDCVASRPGREADFDAAIQQVTSSLISSTTCLQVPPHPDKPLPKPASNSLPSQPPVLCHVRGRVPSLGFVRIGGE